MSCTSLQGQWRPYLLYGDNQIRQLILPDVFDFDSFTDTLIVGPTPMPGSPIAVIGWGINKPQIRVYYITKDSLLQELYWTLDTPGFVVSGNFGPVVKGSVALYAAVRADGDTLQEMRVGFQSVSNPTTITEMSYIPPAADWVKRIYPNMMK